MVFSINPQWSLEVALIDYDLQVIWHTMLHNPKQAAMTWTLTYFARTTLSNRADEVNSLQNAHKKFHCQCPELNNCRCSSFIVCHSSNVRFDSLFSSEYIIMLVCVENTLLRSNLEHLCFNKMPCTQELVCHIEWYNTCVWDSSVNHPDLLRS